MSAVKRKTRGVQVGPVTIGGGAPISVQSMCTTDTRDMHATVAQIKKLEEVGCEIVRVAVPDMIAAQALGSIRKQISIPLVADIHFDYRLALEAINQGVDKIRINPGNIGKREYVEAVAKAAKNKHIPIRIGVNAGSLKILKEFDTWPEMDSQKWAQQMVKEALEQIESLESMHFYDIVISLKATDVERVVCAYRLMASKVDYPLHLGLTEAGSMLAGTTKSAIALGTLLMEGIGDTIRVSLTEDPCVQVRAGYEILKALSLRHYGPDIISCPTCGRCEVDIFKMVRDLEKTFFDSPLLVQKAQGRKIAVMGCVVNGPGEARDADWGFAGGKGMGAFFKNGRVVKNIPQSRWIETLIREIDKV